MRIAATILVTGLAATAACADDDDDAWKQDYSFVWNGEDVTLYGYDHDEAELFAGSLAALETQTKSVMEVLDVEPTKPLVYRWVTAERLAMLCPSWASACTSSGDVYTRAVPDMHEIVHMVAHQLPTRCTAVLEEGLGEYLGNPHYTESAPLDYDLRELMTVRQNPGPGGYVRAGHFVSFLIETFGNEPFRGLCARIPRAATLEDWDRATREVLDLGLDQLIAMYDAYPACTQQQYRARLWECSGEPDFVFTPENRRFDVVLSRDDPRAMNVTPGPRGDAVLTRLVYVDEDTWIDVAPGRSQWIIAEECAPCSASPEVSREHINTLNHQHFRAGLHEIAVFFDSNEGGKFHMFASENWD